MMLISEYDVCSNDYTTGVCEAVCRCPGLSGGGGGTLNVLCAANARQLPHVASDDVHSAMKLKRTELSTLN